MSPSISQPRPKTTVVVVWDLDETLILLDSLLKSSNQASREAGEELRHCILDLAARKFHLSKLGGGGGGGGGAGDESDDSGDCDKSYSDSDEEDDDGEDEEEDKEGLSELAAEASSLYDSGPHSLLSAEASLEAARARSAVDAVSGGWLVAASALLAEAVALSSSSSSSSASSSSRNHSSSFSSSSSYAFRHFVVTAAPLAPTLAKLVVCGLSEFFPSSSVRCCWRRHRPRSRRRDGGKEKEKAGGCLLKTAAFEALKREVEEKQKETIRFVAVGNSLADELAAEGVGFPFLRVGPRAQGSDFGAELSTAATTTTTTTAIATNSSPSIPLRPDALARISTPMTRLTLLDLMRAAGALG